MLSSIRFAISLILRCESFSPSSCASSACISSADAGIVAANIAPFVNFSFLSFSAFFCNQSPKVEDNVLNDSQSFLVFSTRASSLATNSCRYCSSEAWILALLFSCSGTTSVFSTRSYLPGTRVYPLCVIILLIYIT